MSLTQTPTDAAGRLKELAGLLERVDGFDQVLAALNSGHAATLDGAWGSSCALAAAALAAGGGEPLVVVAPHLADLDSLIEELALFSDRRADVFPAWESLPGERVIHDEVFGQRLRVLKDLLAGQATPILVTGIQSLLQPVPHRDRLTGQTRRIAVGDALDVADLSRWMVENHFHNTTAVELPGEFSVRGGIVDVFAPDWDHPVRIELFGDDVDSIRRFEVATQRSRATLDEIEITVLDPADSETDHLCSYLPPSCWFLLIEPGRLDEEGRHYLNRLDAPEGFFNVRESFERIYKFPSVTAESVAAGSFETACHLHAESVERFSGEVGKVRDELDSIGDGQEVFVVCDTEAEVHRLTDLFAGTKLAAAGRLHYPVGHLREGFRLVEQQITLVSAAQMFARTDLRRTARKYQGRAIDSFLDLREGDLVVHLGHGIGRYRGLELLEKERQAEEHLVLEFAEGTKLFVPTAKIDLVQKYVGGSKTKPTLSKIGSASWGRKKASAEKAAVDLAADMLDLQASRASQPGIGFPVDNEWQHEFDAAFPYNETPDQLDAIAALKVDMCAARPMDRLICGDVGYGKTEVAMRAAFKAVDAGYQVAVLVPTTVLAVQHLRTFSQRMAEYPIEIAQLSRFLTRKQQNEVVERLAAGNIDVVIGTHRLASADVQFANLGLVIIDEEQRFGVAVKERLKALRRTVDILTLTATPIPRTLHMSLLGLRDISNLETAPADRLAVETRVTRFDPSLVRHAVLRELNREGQIFFVHNRINDIEIVASKLRQIVPEARIGIGHGQMPEGALEQVMLEFVEHRFDILLATTIIESGLDIPNANTIFIDEADRYGLADLHQLRGRVGRYKHRAYCYLLVDPNKNLSPVAARRLRAIEEFSDMGAGFAVAMRDLEIRGAGNILGTEQSGHIAAVGYELYCRLLDSAVRNLKQLPPKQALEVDIDLPVEAYFPRRYVPDIRLKIDLYRRMARITTQEELKEFRSELGDRFGKIPTPTRNLLMLHGLRIDAHGWRVTGIRTEDEFVVLEYSSRKAIDLLNKRRARVLRIADGRSAYLPLGKADRDPDAMLARLKSLLRPEKR